MRRLSCSLAGAKINLSILFFHTSTVFDARNTADCPMMDVLTSSAILLIDEVAV